MRIPVFCLKLDHLVDVTTKKKNELKKRVQIVR